MANQIKYQVGFDVQKQNLDQLKRTLQLISQMKFQDLVKIDPHASLESLESIKQLARNVQLALRGAFNVKLNTVNIQDFNNKLVQLNGQGLSKTYQELSKLGPAGEAAFRNLSSSVLSTSKQLRLSHNILDKMATTLANTVKWQIASSAINGVTRSIEQAWGYSKALDTSLNNIQIVTGKSADEMSRFAEQANSAAKLLGKTTTDYTDAALIFAQQGLNDEQIAQRADLTLKTANVTGQSAEAVSEELTAVWNGYKVSAEEAELYVDRLAAIAATTASNLGELSTGMSKVAAAAAEMGVGEDQLAAQLSTIIAATKQAPESVGTALRTVYARISDIQAGIELDGTTLGNYSGKMAELGINVLDANGKLRDMGGVIELIGAKWGDMTREQQINLAQTMAGQRQYSNLMALFQNFDKYNEAMQTAAGAAGTLQEQQDIYMESTAAHLQQLKASVEDIYDSLFNMDSMDLIIDGLSDIAELFADFVDSIGGGGQLLKSLGSIALGVFSDQIGKGINTTINNMLLAREQAQLLREKLDFGNMTLSDPQLDLLTRKLTLSLVEALKLQKALTPEQKNELNVLIEDLKNAQNEFAFVEEKVNGFKQALETVSGLLNLYEKIFGGNEAAHNEGIEALGQSLIKDSEACETLIQNFTELLSAIELVGTKGKSFSFEDKFLHVKEKLSDLIVSFIDLPLAADGFMANEIEGLMDEFAKLDLLEKGSDAYNKKIIEIIQKTKDLITLFDTEEEAAKKLSESIKRLAQEANSLDAYKNAKTIIQDYINLFKNLDTATAATKLQKLAFEELEKEHEELKAAQLAGLELTLEYRQKIISLAQKFAELIQKMKEAREQSMDPVYTAGLNDKNALLEYQVKKAEMEKALAKMGNALGRGYRSSQIKQITDMVSGLGQLSMGIQQVQNLGSIWKNLDLSTGQKLLQTVTNIGFSLPMLVNGFTKINTALNLFTTSEAAGSAGLLAFGSAAEGAAVKVTAFGTALSITPFGAFVLALGAAAAAFGVWANSVELGRKAAIQNANLVIDEQNKIQLQIASHDELYSSLEDLNNQYKSGQITRAELQTSVQELTEKYDKEDTAVQNLSGSYADLATAIEKAKDADALALLKSAQEKEEQARKKYDETSKQTLLGDKTVITNMPSKMSDVDKTVANILKKSELVSGAYKLLGEGAGGFNIDVSNPEQVLELYENLNNELKEMNITSLQLKDSDYYNTIKDGLDLVLKSAKEVNEAFESTQNILTKQTGKKAEKLGLVNLKDVNNVTNYIQLVQKLNLIMSKNKDIKDSAEATKKYLEMFGGLAQAKFGPFMEFLTRLPKDVNMTSEALLQMYKNFAGEKMGRLLSIDPEEYNTAEKLAKVLNDLGKAKPKLLSGDLIQKQTEQASENYNRLALIQKKIYLNGKLSSTEAKNLFAEHPELEKYFDKLVDNTYKAKINMEGFSQAISNAKTLPLMNNFISIAEQIEKAKLMQSAGDLGTPIRGGDEYYFGEEAKSLAKDQLQDISTYGDMDSLLLSWVNHMSDLVEKGEATKDTYNEIANKVREINNFTGDAVEKQKELEEASKEAIGYVMDSLDPLDKDIDAQQYELLTNQILNSSEAFGDFVEGFESLLDARDTALDMAEGFLRWDDAIEDANKNFSKWQKNAKNLNKYTDELKDTYEDMLNLDGEILSDQFAEDADNLLLMQLALEGNLDAYNELVDRAQEDLWKNFLDIELGTDAFENIKSDYLNMKSELEKNPIKLGDTIDFSTDTAHQAMADYFEDIGNAAYQNAIAAGKSSGLALTSAMLAEVAAGKLVGYVPLFNNLIIENKDTEEAPEWTTVVTPHDVPLSLPTLTTTSASGTTGTVTTVIPAAPHTEHGEANSVTQTPNSANTTTSKNTSGTGVKLRPVAATNIGGGAPKINNAKKTFNNGGGGSGKKGGGCFAAQTLITIPNNKYKFIEDILIGDIVLSYNVEKRMNEYSQVVETMIHDLLEDIYTIYIEDDILVSTGIHPFYIVRELSYEWVEASDLNIGDLVLFADGTIHLISNIEVNYRSIRVYNFEVSGNHNYYVGINQILVHNKGKGGKGKSEKKDTSKATAIKKEIKKTDPYFRVNRQLSNQERILKDLEKSTEKAFGKNKLDLLEKQAEALKKQNELLNKKQELNKKEIKSLNERYAASKKLAKTNKDDDVAAAIGLTKKEKKKTKNKSKKKQGSKLKKEKFATSLGYGFTYDSDGEIKNYTLLLNEYYAQMEKRRKQYSEAKKKYDKMTKKEQKDKYKKNVLEVLKYNYELWKDRLDKMRDAADKYVDELELNKEITEKLQESFAAEILLRIQKFAVAVEVDLDLREATRKWNDFVRNVINKQDLLKQNPFKDISLDMLRALKDYATYLDKNGIKGTGDLKSLIDQVNKSNTQLQNTLKGDTSGTYGNDISKGVLDLKKWYDQLLDAMQLTVDLQEEIQQGYLDIHENAIEMLDEAIEKREYINELLEHEIDLYQLTYGINPDTDYYNTMNGYYEALYSNQLQQIDRLRANTVLLEKEWQQQLKDGNTELAKQYELAYKSSLSSLNSLLIESIETLKEKYSNAIDGIFNELDRHLSSNASGLGGSSLGYMNMEWLLMNQNAELYLDNVEAMYSMLSLQNKFQKAIDDDKNVKNQQALKKVMDEQLDILKQKGKITKYDVERAEKLLLIEKARIALELAQSNKTSMRLKRDAQGNYSYQFVADTSQVEDAQQALLDLQNLLYTFDKQAYQDNLNNALNAYKDYQSRVKDILLDTALTQEEKDQLIALVKEKLETYITDLAKQNKDIRINLALDTVTALTSTYTDNVAAFSDMTTQQKDLIDKLREGGREAIQGLSDDLYEILFSATGMVENWNTGIQRMINKINSTDGGFEQVCLKAWGNITDATTDYQDLVAKVAEAAGQDLGSITSSTWALNESISTTLNSLKNLTQAFNDQIGTANSLLGKLEELRKAYELLATAAKNAALAAGKTITTASNKIKNGNTTTGGSSGGSGGGGTALNPVTAALIQQQKTDRQLADLGTWAKNNLTAFEMEGLRNNVKSTMKSVAAKYIKAKASTAKKEPATDVNKEIWNKKVKGKKLSDDELHYLAEKLLGITYDNASKSGNLYKKLKEIGYFAKGSKYIQDDILAWTQLKGQEAIYDKSKQAILTPLGKGDKVFTAEMTDALWNVAEAIVNSKQTTLPNNPSWDMLKDQSKKRSINQALADTAKGIAAAVELLRDISQELPTSLFDKAFNLNNGYLKDLIANVSKDVFNNINDTQQTLQTVTITASFPAVNSKKEIEEAFENLINMAAQRTMRNNNDNRRRRGL